MFKKKKVQKSSTMARKLITVANPKSIVSEQFRTIRTNINFSMPDQDLKTLLVTSSTPGEGKSTNSSNIGVVFAQEGKKVLMIDADMRKPTAHHTFGVKNGQGLSSLLTRQSDLNTVIQNTAVENLSIIPSGPIPPNPAELLTSKTMDSLIEELSAQFDMIIFDAPPVLSVADAQILSNKCDGTVLVVNAGEAEKDGVLKAKEALTKSKANILGVIMNNYAFERDHYYYHYYGIEE
ncbi:CpsD/CapB family tyrosine-protein kinase [Lysinibacillus fusiformis]|nr:CpsD/CapB family tyrosine-protein kinase [Lysinibacillus fusiformis]